jgi:hypothetical protein
MTASATSTLRTQTPALGTDAPFVVQSPATDRIVCQIDLTK